MIIRLAALAGSVIATLRTMAGQSQIELGEAAGVAGSQVSGYERSKSIPSLDILLRLLHAAGWHLVAMPAAEAETYDKRAAVVEAAKRLYLADDLSAVEIDASVDALLVAERARAGDADAPNRVEELMRLRDRVDEQGREIERLRDVILNVSEQLDAVVEVHP